MNTRAVLLRTFACVAALTLSAVANAQLPRAYLSSTGHDGGPCTLAHPCRMLPAALDAIVDGGEVWMLDSADYNTASVTIAKSATIQAVPGAVASITSFGFLPAISINASGLTIALRNLQIVAFPGSLPNTAGIAMSGANTLIIENSLIANQPSDGIYVFGPGKLRVTNSIFRKNSINAMELSNGVVAEISGSQMVDNGSTGVLARGGLSAIVTISDSVISGGYDGIDTFTVSAGEVVRVTVTRCTIEGASNAALEIQGVGDGSTILAVSGSTIVNNNYPWKIAPGGTIRSLGNNHVTDNRSAPVGSLTPTAPQ